MSKSGRVRRFPIPTRKYPPRPSFASGRRRRPCVPGCVLGGGALALILAACVFLPMLSPCAPNAMDADVRLQGPSPQHWLGTDQFGRDVGCRLLYGGRISLPVGVLAVLIALLPGLCLGLAAGFYGGWADALIGRLVDVMLAFPGILMALLIVAWLGPGLGNAMLAIGLTGVPRYVRVVRSRALQLRRAWFVRAARVVGCSELRILVRHVAPNLLPSVVVLATLDVGWAILNSATLSFLGLGAQPPTPEWGAMINEGRGFLRPMPWISLAPGTLVALSVLATNVLGDGLRDALDPRLRNRV
jgi:peptide/nickel transport system permease protein